MKQIIKVKIAIFHYWLLIFFVLNDYVFCQSDTILLLSSQKIEASSFLIDDENGLIKYKNKRNKEKIIPIDVVYSVTDRNNNTKILFEPRTIGKISFDQKQMYDFIQGEVYAQKNHKITIPFASGVIIGASSIFMSMYFLGTPFYSPLLPATSIFITGALPISEKKIKKIIPDVHYQNDYFVLGYKENATDMNIKSSIKGNVIGFVLGLAGSIILYNICR